MKTFLLVRRRVARHTAFTIPELLVAMTILSMLLLMLAGMIDQVQRAWTYSESRVSQFREARVAFDIMAKNLSQASLNSYWDYRYETQKSVQVPKSYRRTADLQFLVVDGEKVLGKNAPTQMLFFQAPLGFSRKYPSMNNLLNGRGYFVYFGDDTNFKPSIIKSVPKFRYRLMEFRPTTEDNMIYQDSKPMRDKGEDPAFSEWFKLGLDPTNSKTNTHPLADNIVALVVTPRDTIEEKGQDTSSKIAPSYEFDSSNHVVSDFRSQVPPLVRLTLVAIDETSAIRLENGSTMPSVVDASMFSNSKNYLSDIENLKQKLSDQRLNFKVFSSLVAIRSSKWSAFSGDENN
ncbi:MAG TPA: Verru_Chthon cassette protein C [Verrucomicrobiales bacterium]|nr:Verru_Chthon cassette protein C [Verrucomicrobiales bacterium]